MMEYQKKRQPVKLKLNNGSERIIYAVNVKEGPEVPVQEIKEFIFNQN